MTHNMTGKLATVAAAVIFCLMSGAVFAQDKKGKHTGPEANGPEAGEPRIFESTGAITLRGKKIKYQVRAGETFLRDKTDAAVASMFSVAYTKSGEKDPTKRPVAFVFNGGPGSASLWLHMGAIGPKRVDVSSDAADRDDRPEDDGAAPFAIVDNPASMLDVADLVFIDPIGTGYSRVFGEEDPKNYYGVEEDAKSVGRFIRLWLTQNKRWNSPKYLAGESYGTTRAAALVRELTSGYTDVAFNGVILISAILDFQTARFAPGNDTPHVAFFPSMAAVGWYHAKVDRSAWGSDFDRFISEARTFAVRELAPALLMGTALPQDEYDRVAGRISAFTGLTEGYVKRARLRINNMHFMKELLRSDGLVVGRFDGRYTGKDSNDTGTRFEGDPSGYGMDAAYTAAVNDYFTRNLGIDIVRDYRVLEGKRWNWTMEDHGGWPAYVNVAPWLGKGMRQNREMRVFLGAGWYDLATPFFGAEIAMQKNGIVADRVVTEYYDAGHMMYLREPSLMKLGKDLRKFIEER